MRSILWLAAIALTVVLLMAVPPAGLVMIGVLYLAYTSRVPDGRRDREIDEMLAERRAKHDQR